MTQYEIYKHWQLVPADKWRWPNFTPLEMRCRGTNEILVFPEFMDKLQGLRDILGKPLVISSGYRSPIYNARVSHTGKSGPHTTGRAVDILTHGEAAHEILRLAMVAGFSGVGINQKGPMRSRFIHLDDLDTGTRPTIWSY